MLDDFEIIPLTFEKETHTNVFAKKNNKSVAETLDHRRYSKLAQRTQDVYSDFLDQPLGSFLLSLKELNDDFYRRFLNRYGDLEYSQFYIADSSFHHVKGVYAYFKGDELQYIGRCRDSMKKRIDQGYGKIHPKNCYVDGQATNCHLNSQITGSRRDISLRINVMDVDAEIERIERMLINEHSPPWNIQGRLRPDSTSLAQ